MIIIIEIVIWNKLFSNKYYLLLLFSNKIKYIVLGLSKLI